MKAAMAAVFPQFPITEAHIDFSLYFLMRLSCTVMLHFV